MNDRDCPRTRRWLAAMCWAGLAFAGPAAVDAAPAAPPAADIGEPRTAVEAAARALVGAVSKRLVVRNDQSGLDLWLVTAVDFDRAAELARAAVSSRRTLDEGFRLERFTWLEPDRSYQMELKGGGRIYRVRLTQHLAGSLIEVQGGADGSEAPRWLPTWQPRPLLLLHGPAD